MHSKSKHSSPSWQQQLKDAITDPLVLLAALAIKPEEVRLKGIDSQPEFSLKVPWSYVSRIKKACADDPLLRQVLALDSEHLSVEGESDDAVGELPACRSTGLIHKYHGRVLLVVSGVCAIHCRYCFRKKFPYQQNILSNNLDAVCDYLRQHPEIEEVILSGGDPLACSNHKLFRLCERLEGISHLSRIRIHTRLPIVIPARIDSELSSWLKRRPKQYIFVFHINHPNEIDDEVAQALAKIRHLCLLNQAVLLRGVNDSAATLKQLSTRCFQLGILPYYLHMLDAVSGTSHFKVSQGEALEIMKQLHAELPGYLVPKLVKEYPKAASKTPVDSIVPYTPLIPH